ncbi:hypothetical protein DC439_25605 (plasmid) [Agrobacterium tumefaciens]|jgi:hypothetical protein|nr:hypothetical protein DC439_25605 [Agrobacterium tumefaciens]
MDIRMPLLFCNISWMKHYAGRDPKDPPKGGGGFPRKQGYCGEELNFVPCDDGYVYGHFETIKGEIDRKVAIEKLGVSRTDDYVDDVDIVWTAPVEGNDPRCVIGWYRHARLYRKRQFFNGVYPSEQHQRDEMDNFRCRTRIENAYLLDPKDRASSLMLERGPGWSGQASWWYADDTQDPEARRFVRSIRKLLDGRQQTPAHNPNKRKGKKRAGAATADGYRRYVKAHEAVISPRHNDLHKRFESYLRKGHPSVTFPPTFCDDLRYDDGKGGVVMVEIKPTEAATVRYAIRTAMGQLLDYQQHQQWTGRKLIVVETPVTGADDRALALGNGFGLAWPEEDIGFQVIWPT